MDILIIGNGFDLAHGLKTSYKDFLDFCKEQRVSQYYNAEKIVFYRLYIFDNVLYNISYYKK